MGLQKQSGSGILLNSGKIFDNYRVIADHYSVTKLLLYVTFYRIILSRSKVRVCMN